MGQQWQSLHSSAADGVRLHGWYVSARAKRGVLLFFHGREASCEATHVFGLAFTGESNGLLTPALLD